LRDLNLRDEEDAEIFEKARHDGIVIISKDSDFVEMILRLGKRPQSVLKTILLPPTHGSL
jgi:predicted nuclease of predicted toxin-antitoxin system